MTLGKGDGKKQHMAGITVDISDCGHTAWPLVKKCEAQTPGGASLRCSQ